jgi:hypothetical protein
MRDLMSLHADVLFTHDARGRIVWRFPIHRGVARGVAGADPARTLGVVRSRRAPGELAGRNPVERQLRLGSSFAPNGRFPSA